MEGTPDPDCPFSSEKLTLEHILWQCKETEEERRKSNMTKEVWEKEEEGAKMLVEKHRIILRTIDTKIQIGTTKERTRNDEGNRKWTRKRITKTAYEN
jgi:hypothetical protein